MAKGNLGEDSSTLEGSQLWGEGGLTGPGSRTPTDDNFGEESSTLQLSTLRGGINLQMTTLERRRQLSNDNFKRRRQLSGRGIFTWTYRVDVGGDGDHHRPGHGAYLYWVLFSNLDIHTLDIRLSYGWICYVILGLKAYPPLR